MLTLLASAMAFSILADAQVPGPTSTNAQRDSRDPDARHDPYCQDGSDSRQCTEGASQHRDPGNADGYGRQPLDIASRVMYDVAAVAGNQYRIPKRDRKQFQEVQEELGKFAEKYQHGVFDRNNLSDAADSLRHLATCRAIRSLRDRRVLQDSLNAVESLISTAPDDIRSHPNTGGSVWDLFRLFPRAYEMLTRPVLRR